MFHAEIGEDPSLVDVELQYKSIITEIKHTYLPHH
jgi:hypothetical protein